MASNQLCVAYPVIRFSPAWVGRSKQCTSRVIIIARKNDSKQTFQRRAINNENRHKDWNMLVWIYDRKRDLYDDRRNKITFKRTWSLSNTVCFKYVKYLTTNTAKVGHVTPSRPPLT